MSSTHQFIKWTSLSLSLHKNRHFDFSVFLFGSSWKLSSAKTNHMFWDLIVLRSCWNHISLNINMIQISIFRKSICLVRCCYSNCTQECFSSCYPAFAHQEGRQTLLNKTLIWCLWNYFFRLFQKFWSRWDWTNDK